MSGDTIIFNFYVICYLKGNGIWILFCAPKTNFHILDHSQKFLKYNAYVLAYVLNNGPFYSIENRCNDQLFTGKYWDYHIEIGCGILYGVYIYIYESMLYHFIIKYCYACQNNCGGKLWFFIL